VSVERVRRKGGDVWRVRWRDAAGNPRSKVIGSKRDAELYDAEITRRRRMGDLAQLDTGGETVDQFAGGVWWELHAKVNLTEATRRTYAAIYDTHLLPRVGSLRLRDVTPETVARLRADLTASGVGDAAARKALFLLQGIFTQAVAWGHVRTNPVAAVRKPSGKRKRSVVAPSPSAVEAMRADLRARGRLRDATLVVLLAYSGVRPGEALALRWCDVRERVLSIERSSADGTVKGTKTGVTRTVRLLAPLSADLREWRLASGRPDDAAALVFPGVGGAMWRLHDWKNWYRRVYGPASERAGAGRTRAYDLRHSFCSLLIHEGLSVVEVARQAGHQPSMTLDTYGQVIEELADAERVPAEVAITIAREAHVSESCPSGAKVAAI
jgi:integrase